MRDYDRESEIEHTTPMQRMIFGALLLLAMMLIGMSTDHLTNPYLEARPGKQTIARTPCASVVDPH